MAWEKRRGQKYYYRARRVNGRVVKEYVGRGPVAEAAVLLDNAARRDRETRAKTCIGLREFNDAPIQPLDELREYVSALTDAHLYDTGYFKHRGEWRKRKMIAKGTHEPCSGTTNECKGTTSANDDKVQRSPVDRDTLRALVKQANSGDTDAIRGLKVVLDNHPEIWRKIGDLALHTETLLVSRLALGDQLLLECFSRTVSEMKTELLAAGDSALEKLAVEHVVASWLRLQQVSNLSSAEDESFAHQKFWAQRRDQADRRYLASIKQLGCIRKLLPKAASVDDASAAGDASERLGTVGGDVQHPAAERESSRPQPGIARIETGQSARTPLNDLAAEQPTNKPVFNRGESGESDLERSTCGQQSINRVLPFGTPVRGDC